MAGRIAVVDGPNRFVRWESRKVIHEQQLIHRSVHVLLYDRAGRLLVQRRHHSKQTYPEYWECCAGHVEESDYHPQAGPDHDLDSVYAAVAAREVTEELGVTIALERLGRFPPEPGIHYEQVQLFRGVSDGPFALQADEVSAYRLLAAPELARFLVGGEPITQALRWWLEWLHGSRRQSR